MNLLYTLITSKNLPPNTDPAETKKKMSEYLKDLDGFMTVVLVLRHELGMSHRDIGELTGYCAATIHRIEHQAIERMRGIIGYIEKKKK